MKTGRDAIAAAFINAYAIAENTGSKLAEVCSLAKQTYKGKDIPADDVKHIAATIVKARGWEGPTAKVRASECRKVLGVYARLPEAIDTVRAKHGGCNWRDALKLSTCLAKHDSDRAALAAFEKEGSGSKATPQGRAAGALKAWYKVAKADKKQKILDAADLLGLKLNVTVKH
jgi:hypothetical protein